MFTYSDLDLIYIFSQHVNFKHLKFSDELKFDISKKIYVGDWIMVERLTFGSTNG